MGGPALTLTSNKCFALVDIDPAQAEQDFDLKELDEALQPLESVDATAASFGGGELLDGEIEIFGGMGG